MKLDSWQQEIVDYDGNILLCTGRQAGKTTVFAHKAAKYMIEHKGCSIIIVSITEDQAKLIIIMILDYLERNHRNSISEKKKPTSTKILLNNKSRVIARPVGNTGDAVRGFTGDVLIIDEASRMPELAFEAARPVLLTTGGQIWMCSTPFGKTGYFWESFQNRNNRFKIWHVNSEEVVNNRPINKDWSKEKKEMAIEYLKSEKMDMTELQYGQEYLGLFLEDLRRFFDDDWIKNICTIKRSTINPKDNNYLGVDIARMGNDESSFEVLHENNDKYTHIENITTTKTLTTDTEKRIKDMSRMDNCIKVGIDAGSGSLGVGIYDHLLNDVELKKKVVAMNNRQISLSRDGKDKQRIFKEDMYDNLKSMGEHGELKLLDDDNVQASLRSIQFEFPEDKGQKITKVRIFGNYSHIVEGLIRAAWLAKKEKSKKFFIHYI